MVDLVIRGGTVADGKGGELYEADVAVSDGRIVEVGKVPARGKEEIDAKGKLVTPGFVDVHTHYDGQVTWSHDITPSSENGVAHTSTRDCDTVISKWLSLPWAPATQVGVSGVKSVSW